MAGGIDMIKLTQNPLRANAITHSGRFHADEVLAAVILSRLKKITLCRVAEVPKNIKPNAIVFDIGRGKFDHHQKGRNGVRENGIHYSSAGLIWKEYGMHICKNTPDPEFVWKMIDQDLIQGVDAADNGDTPKSDCPARAMSLSRIVGLFKPTWDSSKNMDEAFLEAFELVDKVFELMFKHAVAKAKAKVEVTQKINEHSQDDILVFDDYRPWKDFIHGIDHKIQFVIYPSDRIEGGYNWHGVPIFPGSNQIRRNVPERWWGLPSRCLTEECGVDDAVFVHPCGFTGGAMSKDGAIAMVQKAIATKN